MNHLGKKRPLPLCCCQHPAGGRQTWALLAVAQPSPRRPPSRAALTQPLHRRAKPQGLCPPHRVRSRGVEAVPSKEAGAPQPCPLARACELRGRPAGCRAGLLLPPLGSSLCVGSDAVQHGPACAQGSREGRSEGDAGVTARSDLPRRGSRGNPSNLSPVTKDSTAQGHLWVLRHPLGVRQACLLLWARESGFCSILFGQGHRHLDHQTTGLLSPPGVHLGALTLRPSAALSPCSSQSLLHSRLSGQQSCSRSLESPASSSSSLHSLGPASLCTQANDTQVPSKTIAGMGRPRATCSPPLAKDHASSCPPSIANSMVDIPIVLINGCPEPGSPQPQGTPGHQDSVRSGVASASNPCPATRSPSQSPPEASPAPSPEGTGKPTPQALQALAGGAGGSRQSTSGLLQ